MRTRRTITTAKLFSLALAATSLVYPALAALFVTSPSAVTSCHGGQPCTIQWLDDGREPLLNVIGPSRFALYDQQKTLVQQIQSAFDVSSTRSLNFTPDPKAGPNSNSYFIWITSNSLKDPNNTQQQYQSFSGAFTIDDMSGAANSPVPSDTSSILITSSPTSAAGSSVAFTSTNGVVSTTTLSAPSGISTTSISSAASQSTQTSSTSSSLSSSTPSSTGSTSDASLNLKPGVGVRGGVLGTLLVTFFILIL